MQVREFLSTMLVSLLSVPLPVDARITQAAAPANEVKLRNKDTLNGRLGPVSQESFRIEYARGEKVIDREVPFDQVKSVKKASGAAVTEAPQKRTVQQQVVEIPTGKLVEVRLTDKSRIRGRIGKISAEGFLLTVAKGSQVEEQKLAFPDVTSIKAIEKKDGGKKGLYIFLGAAIAVGAIFLIAAILGTTSHS
jgi:hypothetical protein